MDLECVETCITNVMTMLDGMVTEAVITQPQADSLLPVLVESILAGNSVGSS